LAEELIVHPGNGKYYVHCFSAFCIESYFLFFPVTLDICALFTRGWALVFFFQKN